MDNLKLRLSWGANGNSAIGRYDAMATMGNIKILQADGSSGAYYTKSGLTINRLANYNLQWEKLRLLILELISIYWAIV